MNREQRKVDGDWVVVAEMVVVVVHDGGCRGGWVVVMRSFSTQLVI